jgi:invasion protein IalB
MSVLHVIKWMGAAILPIIAGAALIHAGLHQAPAPQGTWEQPHKQFAVICADTSQAGRCWVWQQINPTPNQRPNNPTRHM